MKYKVSILVPVYNTKKYLKKCLDSLINQRLQDIEIIITNDGSSDSSEAIINEYLKKDNRIKYFYQENSGLGSTRNNGIENAKGEYLAFLDSDDWVELDCYEKMYKLAKKEEADLVVSDYYIDSLKDSNIFSHKKGILKDEYALDLITRSTPGFSWNKLYKTEVIKNNMLRFPVRNELENVEDQYFSIRMAILANKVVFTNEALIHYIIRGNSIVNRYQKTLIRDGISLYSSTEEFFKNNNVRKIYYDALNVNLINHMCQSISNEVKKDNSKSYAEKINTIKSILETDEYNKVLKGLDNKINNNDKLYCNSISKETRLYMKLLIQKRFKILYLIKFLRVKYVLIRSRTINI